MGNVKKYAILAIAFIVAIVVAFGYGRSTAPENIKEVEIVKEKTDVVYVTKEIKRPDGTIEKETRKETKKEISKENSTVIENKKSQYDIDALYGVAINEQQSFYGLSIQKRIAGNIKAGVFATSNKQVGVSVGFEF